ncbi:MAG TPA: rod shape-determining protein MreC [Candidatus Paceibacterota bacterium]|jgi:Cell shape-determining protein
MTYLKRSNPREKKSKAYIACAALAILILLVIHFFLPGFFRGIFVPAGSAAWQTEEGTETFLGSLRTKYSLSKENADLKARLEQKGIDALLLQAALAENESLKSLVHRTNVGDDILATVLSRPPQSPYDTLTLDVGADEGVSVGDKVYAPGGIVIGDIAEASSGTSKVLLYSSPGRIVPAIVGSSTTQIQAMGKGGGDFSAKLPAEIHVSKGDVVLMPSMRIHTLGAIEAIESDSTDSFQTVLFTLPVNIHELCFVTVDRSGK